MLFKYIWCGILPQSKGLWLGSFLLNKSILHHLSSREEMVTCLLPSIHHDYSGISPSLCLRSWCSCLVWICWSVKGKRKGNPLMWHVWLTYHKVSVWDLYNQLTHIWIQCVCSCVCVFDFESSFLLLFFWWCVFLWFLYRETLVWTNKTAKWFYYYLNTRK